jgi:hypothetical protein
MLGDGYPEGEDAFTPELGDSYTEGKDAFTSE